MFNQYSVKNLNKLEIRERWKTILVLILQDLCPTVKSRLLQPRFDSSREKYTRRSYSIVLRSHYVRMSNSIRRFVATWHGSSRANAVRCVSDGRRGAYCRGVEYLRPFMRQSHPRTPPVTLPPVFLDPAATRCEAIERLYVRRILTQLCLQNSISCVGKAEIKADINPLTILATLYGHWLMKRYVWDIEIHFIYIAIHLI